MEGTGEVPESVDQVERDRYDMSFPKGFDENPMDYVYDIDTMRVNKRTDQVAALLKGINLDLPSEWTDKQILHRVYRHFGGTACRFDDREWIRFVRSLLQNND